MPRPRPPHLHHERTRHGNYVWYVRVGRKGKRIRLHGEFGTPAFNDAYQAAITGKARPVGEGPTKDTLGWLVSRYRESSAWTQQLSQATRRQREPILKQILATAAKQPIGRIDRAAVLAGMERRAHTPFQARHFRDTIHGLFKWAVAAQFASTNPAESVEVHKPKSDGFPPWTDAEIEQYEARWPLGTRERVMLDVFLYTGLRRGDAARVGRPHVRKNVISISTEKNGTRVTIPILPVLARTLRAGPCGELTFIATHDGKPLVKEGLGNLFREACRAAGITKSAHGLRKAAATNAANRGATVAELEAIFGWKGGRMASHYTMTADREALAARAMNKLARTKR